MNLDFRCNSAVFYENTRNFDKEGRKFKFKFKQNFLEFFRKKIVNKQNISQQT